MITAEKPQLNEDLLVHFGIKGMKWGVRRSSSNGSSGKKKMSTGKKVAVGSAVVAGAAAATFILTRSGSLPHTRIGKVDLKPNVLDRLREANKMKVANFNQIAPQFGRMHYFDPDNNGFVVESMPGKALDLIRR